MGWVSGARLTAATSEAGGLGLLASATMTLPELSAAITKVAARTTNPFGVNLLPNAPDVDARIDLLIESGVKVASFVGAPKAKQVERLSAEGIVTMPTIGKQRHAEKMADLGVGAVIAQGNEGGGHTGPIATTLLLPQVIEAVGDRIPVLAAGGFHSGAGLVAAMAYGADGIAMGTRFLLTTESQVPDHVKAEYLKAAPDHTVVTSAIDGAPQRVIRTQMIDALERAGGATAFPRAAWNALEFARASGTSIPELVRSGVQMRKDQDLTWAQVALAANAPMMTKATMVDGRLEAGILPTGQVAGVVDRIPTVAELIAQIVDEAEGALARLGPSGQHTTGEPVTGNSTPGRNA